VIAEMIRTAEKRRHEIAGGRIRAIYGHSIPGKLKRIAASPPDTLFHGTSLQALASIETHGLKPMQRQYVHLSVDEATAIEVGKRKSKAAIMLRVAARKACAAGVAFYAGNDKVWLADEVPPQFIEF
jgi:putative RNA 2'-phosphotransferase